MDGTFRIVIVHRERTKIVNFPDWTTAPLISLVELHNQDSYGASGLRIRSSVF